MKRCSIFMCRLLLGATFLSTLVAEEKRTGAETTYKIEHDILYYEQSADSSDAYKEERCRLDFYYPKESSGFATVVWFHGGGLRTGERFFPDQLTGKGLAIAAVNYRLSPKAKCPAYIEDAAAAVAWVFANIEEYGGSPDLIFVSGHSAGGFLTSMVGLDKQWLAKHNIDADRIAGLVPFSGQTITHTRIRDERGISTKQPIVDRFAPLFHIRPDAPPLVLISGDRNLEIPGRYEENVYMASMMKAVGHKRTELYEMQGFNHRNMRGPAQLILLEHIEKKIKAEQEKS